MALELSTLRLVAEVELYESWYRQLIEGSYITKSHLSLVSIRPGAYVLWMKRDNKCLHLKVGIAGPRRKDGLMGRLRYHFNSNPGNTVLARHMYADLDLAGEKGYDFKQRSKRQEFLDSHCFFKVIVLPSITEDELKGFERYLENRTGPRYMGNVGGPYPRIKLGVCP